MQMTYSELYDTRYALRLAEVEAMKLAAMERELGSDSSFAAFYDKQAETYRNANKKLTEMIRLLNNGAPSVVLTVA